MKRLRGIALALAPALALVGLASPGFAKPLVDCPLRDAPGRMFYSAIGHRPERYSDALYVQMLEQAIGWVVGADGKDCRQAAK